MKIPLLLPVALLLVLSGCASVREPSASAREFWIDLVSGDAVSDDEVAKDLLSASAIFVGETHTIARHHAVQLWLLQELFLRGLPLTLCLEQLEAVDQPAVDRYNRREIDFETLARETNWAAKWRNYPDYRPLCEFSRQHGIPIQALNAPADLIRAVSRSGGVAKLTSEQRAQLPSDLTIDDPVYERLMNLQLVAHMAAEPARLRPMFEAQAARDETMAANIVAARHVSGGTPRTAFVVLGAGHMRYGLGTAASVRRREPAIIERLVLISESGHSQLSEAEKAVGREIDISHSDLLPIGRSPGDYLRMLPPSGPTLPPGHPPISPASSSPAVTPITGR